MHPNSCLWTSRGTRTSLEEPTELKQPRLALLGVVEALAFCHAQPQQPDLDDTASCGCLGCPSLRGMQISGPYSSPLWVSGC